MQKFEIFPFNCIFAFIVKNAPVILGCHEYANINYLGEKVALFTLVMLGANININSVFIMIFDS